MKKRYQRTSQPTMRRSARVFLNAVNVGKAQTLTAFLHTCHDATQYFIDLFWQHQDFSANLAKLDTVHRGRDRFGLTTRLAQALAKQAKEMVRSAHEKGARKPRLRRHVVTLYSHFVRIEPFNGTGFDWAICLIGSGAPRLILPIPSTQVINTFLGDGWTLGKTIRLGHRGHRLFVDLLFDKPRPPWKSDGAIVGMDANYKAGLVLSDGQVVGEDAYRTIQTSCSRLPMPSGIVVYVR